jgi:4-oxalocrotonate tautomerase
MPIVTVAMYSGRTQRDKDRLAEAITEDVVNILKVEKKDVIVVARILYLFIYYLPAYCR